MFRVPKAFESHAATGGLIGTSVASLCLLALGWMYAQGNLARREAVAIAFSAAAGVFIGFADPDADRRRYRRQHRWRPGDHAGHQRPGRFCLHFAPGPQPGLTDKPHKPAFAHLDDLAGEVVSCQLLSCDWLPLEPHCPLSDESLPFTS